MGNSTPKQVQDYKTAILLCALCWGTYAMAYLARLNYTACMNEIILSEGLSKSEAGLIGTGFFFTYGIGQLINGFVGDRVSPKWMVFWGLVCSALCNLLMPLLIAAPFAMIIVWCVNGLAQSMLWAPIIRIIADYFPSRFRIKASTTIASSPVVGTLLAYATSAVLIMVADWQKVFYLGAIAAALAGIVWLVLLTHIDRHIEKHGEAVGEPQRSARSGEHPAMSTKTLFLSSGMLIVAVSMVMQGVLKEGVTTWVPTYINEIFNLPSAMSIVSTALIPICNLAGVYLVSLLYKRRFRDELATSQFCFVIGGVCFSALAIFPNTNILLSLLLLCGATTAMMGVNVMMTSVLPVNCARTGKSASVSGLMNASVHMGSALSSYGIGLLITLTSWSFTIIVWVFLAFGGVLLLAGAKNRWSKYKKHWNCVP